MPLSTYPAPELELGVVLPVHGASADPVAIRAVTRAAEDLGYTSVWTTDHLIVDESQADPYGTVYGPITTLSWLAAQTSCVSLGTSVVVLPIHDPFEIAKQSATLQQLSRGRHLLGVGAGWHEPEFRHVQRPYDDRGDRTDEQIDLIRALWEGETSFEGPTWTFEDAVFGPTPDVRPEIWVGGNSSNARQRTLERGDTWHPLAPDLDDVKQFREDGFEGRIVPRIHVELDGEPRSENTVAGDADEVLRQLGAYLDAGCDGFVFSLEFEAAPAVRALADLADQVLPELRS